LVSKHAYEQVPINFESFSGHSSGSVDFNHKFFVVQQFIEYQQYLFDVIVEETFLKIEVHIVFS